MSLTFLLAALVFAAAVGGLVACIDRWRESRLVTRPAQHVGVPVAGTPAVPASRNRAA